MYYQISSYWWYQGLNIMLGPYQSTNVKQTVTQSFATKIWQLCNIFMTLVSPEDKCRCLLQLSKFYDLSANIKELQFCFTFLRLESYCGQERQTAKVDSCIPVCKQTAPFSIQLFILMCYLVHCFVRLSRWLKGRGPLKTRHLIELYQQHPKLWDPWNSEYQNRFKKTRCPKGNNQWIERLNRQRAMKIKKY